MNRAAVLKQAKGPVVVEELEVPRPGPGQVLVKMEACGICHSDLFIAGLEKPPLIPLVLGHEGIGRVVETGPAAGSFKAGDRVGITFLASSCAVCEWCASERERFCPKQLNSGYTSAGVLAQYACVAAQHLVRVPEKQPAAELAPLCCAGWTAYAAVRETGLEPGRTLAVFGMGGLGHLAVQYAIHRKLRVAAVDVEPTKLELAREIGASIVVPAENAGRALQKQHGGVDAAVVLTPSVSAIGQALRALTRCGTLVLVGLSPEAFELPVIDTVMKGITLRGSFLGTRSDLAEVFRLAESGAARPRVERHALEETPELLEKMHRGELLGRAVIEF